MYETWAVYKQEKRNFIIYENPKEIEEYNIQVIELPYAKEGDYILTSNGYYIPIVSYKEKFNLSNGKFVRYQFPRYHWDTTIKQDGSYNFKQLIYPGRDKYEFPETAFVPKKQQLLAELIKKGMDFNIAFNSIYKIANMFKRHQVQYKLLASKKFINYLFKDGDYMKQLKDSFIEAGITQDTFAAKIAEIVNDPEEQATLRKYAFEVCLKVFDDSNKPNQLNQTNNYVQQNTLVLEEQLSNKHKQIKSINEST